MERIIEIVLIAIAIENCTDVFQTGEVFKSIRKFISKSDFLDKLINCFICLSVWVTVFIVVLNYFIPILIKVFAVHGISKYIHKVYKVYGIIKE